MANVFDGSEDLLAFVVSHGVAQHATEKADILAEREVLVVLSGSSHGIHREIAIRVFLSAMARVPAPTRVPAVPYLEPAVEDRILACAYFRRVSCGRR
jgi:hypothetical protein